MDLRLVIVPYDTARRGERMGAGPEHLLRSGAEERLRAAGHRVAIERIEAPVGAFPAEIATSFALHHGVAAAVYDATAGASLPVVLSGNCNMAAVGSLAALGPRAGVLWFDSHGDFNTPETTIGGFLDGMALAIATGRCWRQLTARLSGFAPVDEANVVLLGTRDLDVLEEAALTESSVSILRPAEVRTRLDQVLDGLRERVRDVYVHVDLDVLDPATQGRANSFAAPDGLTVDEVAAVIRRAARDFHVRGAALTAYDPTFDGDGRVCRAALTLLATLAEVAAPVGPHP